MGLLLSRPLSWLTNDSFPLNHPKIDVIMVLKAMLRLSMPRLSRGSRKRDSFVGRLTKGPTWAPPFASAEPFRANGSLFSLKPVAIYVLSKG